MADESKTTLVECTRCGSTHFSIEVKETGETYINCDNCGLTVGLNN
jgi:transcription elongation factor Elf1